MIPNFPAETARLISINDLTTFEEIVVISREIITQSLAGSYEATVSADTIMTDTPEYAEVWQGLLYNRQYIEQMNAVISHFEKYGYTITRQLNSITGNTIIWVVQW